MIMSDSVIDVGGASGGWRLSGELTIQHAAAQGEQLRQWIGDGMVSVDLSAVEACDSSGVQLLVAARRSVAARGQSLELRDASAPVRDVFGRFALTGLLSSDVVTREHP
jgi:anti-anti-sigma factor